MKSKFSFLIIFIIIYFIFNSTFAQTTVAIDGDFMHTVCKYKYGGNTLIEMGAFPYQFGRVDDSYPTSQTTEKDTYRSEFKFDLSDIPENIVITNVHLTFTPLFSNPLYALSIKHTSGTKGLTELWNEISTATSLFSNITYANHVLTGSTLTNTVDSAIGSELFMGVKSSNEDTTDTGNRATMSLSITYLTTTDVTVKNDMNGFNGGNIGVGVDVEATSKSSPFSFTGKENENINLLAIENQSYNNYNYIWNDSEAPLNKSDWKKQKGASLTSINYSQSTTYQVKQDDNAIDLIANLRKVCNLTFTTNLGEIGVTEPCSIKVDGAIVVTPTAQYPVVEQNTIVVEAIDKTVLDVHLKFEKWIGVPISVSTNNPITITADATETIKAVYVKEPDTIAPSAPQNVTITESTNEHPIISWDANPELDMRTYKVYRKRNAESWSLRYTLSSDDYISVEDEYVTTTYRHGDDIYYKVQAEDIWNNLSDFSSTVDIEARYLKQNIEEEVVEEKPKQYALNSNYPNPFNPTTRISYQIPKDGFVSLVVYNALGQEVAVLVNQHQSIGKYSVQFSASNLPSGVYIYKLHVSKGSTTNFSSVKKMMLTK